MSYFWTNLAAHLMVSLLLLILFLASVKNNQESRWKRGFFYLMPFVLMIILLVQVCVFSVPRILDSTTVLRSTFRMGTGTIESVSSLKDHVVIDGKQYYVNPFDFELEVGDRVNIRYTPYAHYAYTLEKADEDEED